jgi:hypothetical protein
MSEFSKITCGEIENVLRDLPGDIESISRLLRGTACMERINLKVMALLLAAGADGEYAGDGPGWLAWARQETKLADSTLYHRLAAGRVLVQFQEKAVIYRHLLEWEIEKIYALVKLPPESREAFLSQTSGVWGMDRDDLRFAAECFLARLNGLPEPERKTRGASPDLPGFGTILDKLDDMKQEECLRELEAIPERAHVAAGVGLSLLDAYLETQKNSSPEMRNENGLRAIQEELTRKMQEVAELLSANQGDHIDENLNPAADEGDAEFAGVATVACNSENGPGRGVACDSCNSGNDLESGGENGGFAQTVCHSGGVATVACNRGNHLGSGVACDSAGAARHHDSTARGVPDSPCSRGAEHHANTACSACGGPGGSGGTRQIYPPGKPDQGGRRLDDDAGRVSSGGGESCGRIPDPGPGRTRQTEPADIQ